MDAAEPPLVAARPSHALRSKPSMKRRKAPPLKTIQTAAQGAGAAKDDTIGRIQPSGDLADAKERSPPKTLGKVTRKVSATGRPIVPLTEQKSISRSRTLSIGKRDEERDRWDVAPDGASAGREGRQFTVANVGNNGKLFLRPSVRRGNKRYPQPNFTFPITPPGTAGLEGAYPENSDEPPSLTADHHENQFTPTPRTSIIPPAYAPDLSNLASQHRRAVSDGTIRDFNSPTGTDTDGYRIVITKPTHGDDHRPKTTEHLEDLDVDGVPMLNINIPSWKLGTPRFSTRGTPMLRGSSYAPTDDFRSNSRASMYHSSERSLGAPLSGLRSRRPSHLVPPKLRFPRTSHASSQASTRPPRVVPSTYASTHLIIEPDMFDELTFKPTCDDKLIVRYSPSGSVTAATPSRLVAEITSPSFLDYELISDFFLTFRAFLEPDILLRMLMARLRWALERTDEIGMIVRVRTFVAMRHWILNYFVDDFVLDYDLRVIFCILLNDLFDELSQDARERRVQLKILTELKKCWRRICAHYWDGPDFDDSLGPGAPVAPGGIAGYRDPNLDPTFWEREGVDPPQWHAVSGIPDGLSDAPNSSAEDVPTTARFGDFTVSDHRPGTPEHQIITTTMVSNGPASPLSIASMDIVSCSFPTKNVRSLNPNSSQPLAAHPVYSTSPILPPGAIATTPKALSGKRVRPAQSHGRNNSATDSIRAPSSGHSSSQDVDLHMILQSAGNLVRGNILPPGQPFVDIESGTPTGDNRQTTIFQPVSRNAPKDRIFGVAMSGSGMKKFLGGVRRALNNRGQWSSGSHTSLPAVASLSAHTVSIDQLPGPTIITQGGYAQTTSRPQVRIDVLGAEVAEDFKRAIREEEEAAEAERLGVPRPAPTPVSTRRRRHMEYSVAHMESSTGDYLPQNRRSRPMSDMGLTTGSQSIVIVDDTVPFDMPGIRDRLPATTFNPSAGGLSVGSFLTAGGDPTPPTTPPAQLMAGTPRRSSYLLDQLVALPSASQGESLPPFVPDMATLGHSHTYSQGQSDDASRVSFSTMRRSIQRRPPLSRGTLRVHRRNQSTNTQQSNYSFRRHASFGSHLERHSTARSFDATTDSSLLDREYEAPAVEPPRILRRRPGGYLRAAVNNVAGLNNQPTVRKSHSVGSLTNYTDSVRSSYLLGTHAEQDDDDRSFSGAGDHPRERQEIFSVGQLTEKPAKRHLSLFSTHSSKPIMRPSFEIEARKLAQIPDEDDGGIESALLKLEGKYQPKPKSFEQLRQTAMIDANEFGGQAATADSYTSENQSQESEAGGMDDDYHSWDKGKQPQDTGHNRDTLIAPSRIATLETRSFLTADSDESYCSIPLLERGLTDDGQSNRGTSQWTNRSVLRGSSDEDDATTSDLVATRSHQASHQASSSHLSYDFVQKTESIERVKTRKTASLPVAEDQTFLEDASVGGSDLSSELSPSEDEGSNNSRERAGVFSISSQPHPFGDPIATPRSNSSSAPMTLAQALAMSPVMMSPVLTNTERTLDLDQIWTRTPLPLSPEIFQDGPNTAEHVPPRSSEALPPLPQPETPNTLKYSIHLPFILAFESDILAQQFTLIEKDALNDIDWRELIEMNWRNATSNDSRSWVDFLRNTNAHGVEVVVARFNIMVKWAISEIVLTQHIEERARCIIKLIHIAAHCRRYRNFATLAQLTIALSSAEVARLSKTWDLVPARDLNTLGELEALVTPSRNFYSLRAEMEVGSDGGCIPFVGIYTHDLLFNAQRPSEIASSPTTPPLINFERCRIGAAVVKTLLRLLEASTRYTFQAIEGITERCLWMGALNDDEIRRHSEALE